LGARFCTTCGHKIAADEAATAATPTEVVVEPSETANAEAGDETPSNGGWPTVPAAGESAPEIAWATPPSTNATITAEATANEVNEEEPSGAWPAGSTTSWPSPPAAEAAEPTSDVLNVETNVETEVVEEESASTPTEADPEAAIARSRATRLLDELREAISAISGDEPRDLSGVISELEVAVTPPGAIGADELNELREALLKARERPRDIDTIVDLTGRLDAIVALIFAYDRTVAAIERSLDVLKRESE
jgi:hypothetical protein